MNYTIVMNMCMYGVFEWNSIICVQFINTLIYNFVINMECMCISFSNYYIEVNLDRPIQQEMRFNALWLTCLMFNMRFIRLVLRQAYLMYEMPIIHFSGHPKCCTCNISYIRRLLTSVVSFERHILRLTFYFRAT